MKRMWCAAMVIAAAASVAAQGGAGGTTQKPATKPSASGTVTLTGCLQADKNKSTFWLSDAGTATSSAKVDQTKKTAAAETYRLNPTNNVVLEKHVGHKVEIQGSFEASGAGRTARGTSGAAADAETKHLENARQVNVTALKHISPVCEAAKQ